MAYQRNGGDRRGNNLARHLRQDWLLGIVCDRSLGWAPFGGNGKTVPCYWCKKRLNRVNLQQDRKVPGASYRRTNILPACGPCNRDRDIRPEEYPI